MILAFCVALDLLAVWLFNHASDLHDWNIDAGTYDDRA